MQVATNLAAIGGAVALVAACSAEPPTIMKTLPPVASEAWVPQDIATNVQDWDRAAKRIADGLELMVCWSADHPRKVRHNPKPRPDARSSSRFSRTRSFCGN